MLGLMALALAGATSVETITYSRGPCFGTCPVYTITVSSDGRGRFEGRNHTAVTGTRSFRVTPAEFREFRRRLQADRPVGEVLLTDQRMCPRFATDHPTIDVRWVGGGRRPAHLALNTGCDFARHARMQRALESAPAALPIGDFIGRR